MEKTLWTPAHRVLREILVEARKEKGLSQVEVARRLGQHQSFVSKYETGERRLDLAKLAAVAGALGVSLAGLVRRFEKGMKRG